MCARHMHERRMHIQKLSVWLLTFLRHQGTVSITGRSGDVPWSHMELTVSSGRDSWSPGQQSLQTIRGKNPAVEPAVQPAPAAPMPCPAPRPCALCLESSFPPDSRELCRADVQSRLSILKGPGLPPPMPVACTKHGLSVAPAPGKWRPRSREGSALWG